MKEETRKRIEELEKRVRELESRPVVYQQPSWFVSPPVPGTQPYAPPWIVTCSPNTASPPHVASPYATGVITSGGGISWN